METEQAETLPSSGTKHETTTVDAAPKTIEYQNTQGANYESILRDVLQRFETEMLQRNAQETGTLEKPSSSSRFENTVKISKAENTQKAPGVIPGISIWAYFVAMLVVLAAILATVGHMSQKSPRTQTSIHTEGPPSDELQDIRRQLSKLNELVHDLRIMEKRLSAVELTQKIAPKQNSEDSSDQPQPKKSKKEKTTPNTLQEFTTSWYLFYILIYFMIGMSIYTTLNSIKGS